MKRLLIALSIIICQLSFSSTGAQAQTQVSGYAPGVTPDGATFFLPKTAIRISVLAEKTTYTPGEYAAYAQRFLRLNNISTETSESYRVISISQTAIGVADTTKAYTVKFSPKTAAINVALAQDGTLLAINGEAKEQVLPQPFQAAPKMLLPDPHRFQNQEILAAGSLAKMAQLTAEEIYDLRENRSLLIKGQADFMPQDGQQMKLMLNQLDQQDRALTSMFAGTTVSDTTEYVFYVVPDKDIEGQTLFRFSRHFGLVDADDLSGAPYTIAVTDLKSVPMAAPANKKKKAENGLYYNVPGRLRSVISQGTTILSQEEMPAAQFGHVELLVGDLFNKHYGTHLWLDPVTGAINKLEAEQPK